MSGPITRSQKGETGENHTNMGKPEGSETPPAKKILTLEDLYVEIKKNQEGNTRIETKLADIDSRTTENADDIKKHIEKYEGELVDLQGKHDSVDSRVTEIEDAFDAMSMQFREMKEENLLLRKRVYQLEKVAKVCTDREEELKRQNIVIQGIPESPYTVPTRSSINVNMRHMRGTREYGGYCANAKTLSTW